MHVVVIHIQFKNLSKPDSFLIWTVFNRGFFAEKNIYRYLKIWEILLESERKMATLIDTMSKLKKQKTDHVLEENRLIS